MFTNFAFSMLKRRRHEKSTPPPVVTNIIYAWNLHAFEFIPHQDEFLSHCILYDGGYV